jgi:hypothetical protein
MEIVAAGGFSRTLPQPPLPPALPPPPQQQQPQPLMPLHQGAKGRVAWGGEMEEEG